MIPDWEDNGFKIYKEFLKGGYFVHIYLHIYMYMYVCRYVWMYLRTCSVN